MSDNNGDGEEDCARPELRQKREILPPYSEAGEGLRCVTAHRGHHYLFTLYRFVIISPVRRISAPTEIARLRVNWSTAFMVMLPSPQSVLAQASPLNELFI